MLKARNSSSSPVGRGTVRATTKLVHLKADVIVTSVRRRARRSSRRLVHAIVNCAVLTPASRRTTLNHMVYFSDVLLDRAFAALADPTRRAILDRLAHDSELAVTQIAGRFDVSLPGVIKLSTCWREPA